MAANVDPTIKQRSSGKSAATRAGSPGRQHRRDHSGPDPDQSAPAPAPAVAHQPAQPSRAPVQHHSSTPKAAVRAVQPRRCSCACHSEFVANGGGRRHEAQLRPTASAPVRTPSTAHRSSRFLDGLRWSLDSAPASRPSPAAGGLPALACQRPWRHRPLPGRASP
jgi:hypothetical protein